MYKGTPWGYLQEKKKVEQLEGENKKLKEIVKKLLMKQELTESEKEFLKKVGDVFG